MAKFITIPTADATRGKILVNTEQIFMVVPGDESAGGDDIATECTIFPVGSDFLSSYINLKTAGGTNNTGTELAAQINKAIVANPGGQHATVNLLDGMSITDTVIL